MSAILSTVPPRLSNPRLAGERSRLRLWHRLRIGFVYGSGSAPTPVFLNVILKCRNPINRLYKSREFRILFAMLKRGSMHCRAPGNAHSRATDTSARRPQRRVSDAFVPDVAEHYCRRLRAPRDTHRFPTRREAALARLAATGDPRPIPAALIEADRELVRLSHADGACRLAFGELVAVFTARRLHGKCGFVRVADYARERLRVSLRTVQDAARVARALENLPALRRALVCGEFGWSSVRVLVRVATRKDEERWLDQARRISSARLAALVAEQRASDDCERPIDDEFADRIDGEERRRFSLQCPPSTRRLWQWTIDTASRLEGGPIPPYKALELVAADALAGNLRESGVAVRDRSSDPAEGRPGSMMSGWPGESFEPRGNRPEREAAGEDAHCRFARADVYPIDLHAPLQRFLTGIDHLPAAILDRRLHELRRIDKTIDARLSFFLSVVAEDRGYRCFGFNTLGDYVRERLGLSPGRARQLLALARGLDAGAPELRRAFAEGRVSVLAAAILLRVARPATASAWIARAGCVTLARLEREADWARDRMLTAGNPSFPPAAGQALEPSDTEKLSWVRNLARCQNGAPRGAAPEEPVRLRIAVSGPRSVIEQFERALALVSRPAEPPWRAFERLLCGFLEEWLSLAPHRDPVFARDGWRCAVPGCTSRRNLQDHHLRYRSRGGGNQRGNRISVCATHHLRGIHRGLIEAEGNAPDRVRWRLGKDLGGFERLELVGHQYLRPQQVLTV